MPKILFGKVVSAKMQKTAVVEIESRRPHPKYRKMVKKNTKIKVETGDVEARVGDLVRIQEVRPISRDKNFKLMEVIKK